MHFSKITASYYMYVYIHNQQLYTSYRPEYLHLHGLHGQEEVFRGSEGAAAPISVCGLELQFKRGCAIALRFAS